MKIEELKNTLKELFANNRIKQVLNLLKQELDDNSEYYDSFLMNCNRFNAIQEQLMINVISHENANVDKAKINSAILQIINSLQQIDLKQNNKLSHKEVSNPILVVTSSNSNFDIIKDFFLQLNFVNISVQSFEQINNTNEFDLIILDNRGLPACPNHSVLEKFQEKEVYEFRIQKMNEFIKNTTKFFIYWGEYLFWVNENRERVHAANSKFALYARIKEMLDFINTFKV